MALVKLFTEDGEVKQICNATSTDLKELFLLHDDVVCIQVVTMSISQTGLTCMDFPRSQFIPSDN